MKEEARAGNSVNWQTVSQRCSRNMKSTYLAGVADLNKVRGLKRGLLHGRIRLDGFKIAALLKFRKEIFEVIDVCSLTKLSLEIGSLSIPNVFVYIDVLF